MDEKLHQLIKEQTYRFLIHKDLDLLETDASTLSIDLKLDRANISRTLNKAWRDDEVIKIKGRPTFFLDKEILINHYNIKTSVQEYTSHEDLLETLEFYDQDQNENYHFKEHIGSRMNESMFNETKQLVDYFDYPLSSYNIHVIGKKSTGKLSYCEHIYRYFNMNIYKSKQVEYQVLDCHIYQEKIVTEFSFLKEKKSTSFIVFHRIDALTDSIKNQLIQRIEQSNKKDVDSVYIFTSRDSTSVPSTFYTHTINVPDFKHRWVKDKIALIFQAFDEEVKEIKIPILLRRNIINCFLTSDYDNNIAGLNNEIRNTCIRAHSRMKKEGGYYLDISLEDLSDAVLKNIKNVNESLNDLNKIYDRLGTSRFYIREDQAFEELKLLENIGLSNRESVKPSDNKSKQKYLDQAIREVMNTDQYELEGLSKNIADKLFEFVQVDDPALQPFIYSMAKHLRVVMETEQRIVPNIFNKTVLDDHWEQFYQKIEMSYNRNIPPADKGFLMDFYQKSLDIVRDFKPIFIYVSHWKITESQIVKVFPSINLSHIELTLLNSRNQHAVDSLLEITQENYQGKEVVFISDGSFDTQLVQAIKDEANIQIEFISDITLNQAEEVYALSEDPLFHIDQLKKIEFIKYSGSLFNQLSYGLKTSLKIFDAIKVTEVLVQSYYKIISDLNLVNEDDILGHYVFEAAFAYERVLIDQRFVQKEMVLKNEDIKIRSSIENSLNEANALFGRSLPQYELNHLTGVIKNAYQT